jgi:medium-chain acyl-[acyl-carrier-protein] hydrolase
MLGRLRLVVDRYAAWGDRLDLRTWPSCVRGRLTAVRDFVATGEDGATLLRGTSDWLYVDMDAQRVVRLPSAFGTLAPEGTPRSGVPDVEGKIPDFGEAAWRVEVTVRQGDLDFNRHVNSAHYVEWALECLSPKWQSGREVGELDIAYRKAAHGGDTVVSEAALAEDGSVLHRIRNAADGEVLATARTVWRGKV